MKTYRIVIEYTQDEKVCKAGHPDSWDWPELLSLDWAGETFGVWVEDAPLNKDHADILLETQRSQKEWDEEVERELMASGGAVTDT